MTEKWKDRLFLAAFWSAWLLIFLGVAYFLELPLGTQLLIIFSIALLVLGGIVIKVPHLFRWSRLGPVLLPLLVDLPRASSMLLRGTIIWVLGAFLLVSPIVIWRLAAKLFGGWNVTGILVVLFFAAVGVMVGRFLWFVVRLLIALRPRFRRSTARPEPQQAFQATGSAPGASGARVIVRTATELPLGWWTLALAGGALVIIAVYNFTLEKPDYSEYGVGALLVLGAALFCIASEAPRLSLKDGVVT